MVEDAGEVGKRGKTFTPQRITSDKENKSNSNPLGYGHIGIVNNSNMCFFNSMLQVRQTPVLFKLDYIPYSANCRWLSSERNFSRSKPFSCFFYFRTLIALMINMRRILLVNIGAFCLICGTIV